MEIYLFTVGLLFVLAAVDLVVGVSNDAVNFLNSAVGSRVAPRHVVMTVASLGILAGVTFSSGMMEVARKGIFHPRLFSMPELLTIFAAVMLADVLLLDLFNTFGLPTSTTVSIVFELLGAATALSLTKVFASNQGLLALADYINTAKALAIISGILLSVAVAFVAGVLSQFATRLLFTFDYHRRLRRYGAMWSGMALAMITYFILIKGAKGTSFMTPTTIAWIKTNKLLLLGGGFISFTAIFQLLLIFSRIDILKPVVLVGTFALAMAFAANDLVNFIGVPLAGYHAFDLARSSADPLTASMAALQGKVPTGTGFLLAAGAVMVSTLWLSRKARTVTRTELSLGRQEEGLERFGSSQLSRIIVRMVVRLAETGAGVLPGSLRRWINCRLNPAAYGPETSSDGSKPEFDLLRASVNLMVASALVAWATSLKLPLSTTYVTFMVAMGTSLADKAWGLDSAVYRVTGVLTVIGGWFFTAMLAFALAFTSALAIHFLDGFAIIGLMVIIALLVMRNLKIHGRREKDTKELEALDLGKVKNSDQAVQACFEQCGKYLNIVRTNLSACFEGILTEDRKALKKLRHQTRHIQSWSNIIVANIFKALRMLQGDPVREADKYAYVIAALQEIAESLRDLILRCHVHVSNQHSGLLPEQKKELQQVRRCVEAILDETAEILTRGGILDYRKLAAHYVELKQLIEQYDSCQVERIRSGASKTRLSILFYGICNACQKISQQTLQLATIFDEALATG